MGIPPWFLCPPALLEPCWWCCCASPMCTAQSLLPPGAVTTTLRHCPRAWGNYFTSTRGSQSRHRRARVPPRTNRINTTPTALGGARGCRTRLDCTGIWILVCVLLRRLKLRWNTSTAQAGLQKQPSLPAMCSLFIKTRHFCADTTPAQSCSSSGWDSALKGIVQTVMEPNPAAGGDTATAASHWAPQLCPSGSWSRSGSTALLPPQWHPGILLSRAAKLPLSPCAGYSRLIQTLPSHFCLDERRVDQPAHLWLVCLACFWFVFI